MGLGRDENENKLRVVEEVTHSEEVLRLKGEEVEEVARIPVPAPAEGARRLQSEVGDMDRRTHEPDIDVIIEDARESEDVEEIWEKSGQKAPVPYGWFVLIFVGLVAVVGTTIFYLSKPEGEREVDVARQVSVERMAEVEDDELEATRLVDDVEHLIRDYSETKEVDGMLAMVRDPERVEPLMREWYAEHEWKDRPFGRMRDFRPVEVPDKQVILVRYEIANSDETVDLLVEREADGRVLVDWETDVYHQPQDWNEYVKERPQGVQMFRVYVGPDREGWYSHEFGDEREWFSFRLMAKGEDEFLIGYAKRSSDLARELFEMIENNRMRPAAACLELRVPEGVESPRGVEIVRVVAPRWILTGEK